ncbi:MAG: ANTAR domain-containing protein [Pseudomonadales bacterium]|nr:ANTAR domain-containing protein [Pseudomonadales bacterium]
MNKTTVLIVDKDSSRASLLNRALKEYGYDVLARLRDGKALLNSPLVHETDVVVIGIDLPDQDTLNDLAILSKIQPRPVVMFAEKDAPEIVQRVIKAGVSAFIIDDIQPQRLESIIQVAQARFEEYQGLRNELQHAKNQLLERKVIDKAKGMIMQQQGMNEDEAYKSLRKLAMDKGQTIARVAQNIIDVLNLIAVKA